MKKKNVINVIANVLFAVMIIALVGGLLGFLVKKNKTPAVPETPSTAIGGGENNGDVNGDKDNDDIDYDENNNGVHKHSYSDIKITDATCTEYAYAWRECTECGEVDILNEKYSLPLGHEFNGPIFMRCGASCVEHEYEVTETVEATCTEKGYKVYTCKTCGDTYNSDYTNVLGHDFLNGLCTRCNAEEAHQYELSGTVEPTCTEKGYTQYTCKTCNDSYRNEVSALGHSFNENEVCTRCGLSKHVHSYTDNVVEPTCTENGYTQHICSCGNKYSDTVTEKLGHDSGICNRCGYAEKHVHSFKRNYVQNPTCTEKGYTLYVCSCGERKTDDIKPAYGHYFYLGVCTTCGEDDPALPSPNKDSFPLPDQVCGCCQMCDCTPECTCKEVGGECLFGCCNSMQEDKSENCETCECDKSCPYKAHAEDSEWSGWAGYDWCIGRCPNEVFGEECTHTGCHCGANCVCPECGCSDTTDEIELCSWFFDKDGNGAQADDYKMAFVFYSPDIADDFDVFVNTENFVTLTVLDSQAPSGDNSASSGSDGYGDEVVTVSFEINVIYDLFYIYDMSFITDMQLTDIVCGYMYDNGEFLPFDEAQSYDGMITAVCGTFTVPREQWEDTDAVLAIRIKTMLTLLLNGRVYVELDGEHAFNSTLSNSLYASVIEKSKIVKYDVSDRMLVELLVKVGYRVTGVQYVKFNTSTGDMSCITRYDYFDDSNAQGGKFALPLPAVDENGCEDWYIVISVESVPIS